MSDTGETVGVVLGESVRASVSTEQKKQLQELARRRQLRDADILREAIRFYLRMQLGQLDRAAGELQPATSEH